MPDNDSIYSDAEIAAAERFLARPWEFILGAPSLEFLPEADRPEIAFAGRSNVGKSSLINALSNRRNLARTSNTPGRTQELNYFAVSGADFYFVDMPGYGYAKAPKAKVEAWTQVIKDYLRGRVTLRRVYVLIDARHGVKHSDEPILALLDEAAVPYQIVLTKIDKIKSHAVAHAVAAAEKTIAGHPAAFPVVLATSSEKRIGLGELKASIANAVA